LSAAGAPLATPKDARSGKIAVLAIAALLVFILIGYRYTLPDRWLRAFAEQIAMRAALDPNPPIPDDTRQASDRIPADNPLICMRDLPAGDWDTIVFVKNGQRIADHPVLNPAAWDDRAETERLLASDDRYQMIVLLKDKAVIDHELFFTFWGDLSALTRPEGFTRDTAIFTAASRGGRYVLSLADGAQPSDCPK
jgi:hypothetical protein